MTTDEAITSNKRYWMVDQETQATLGTKHRMKTNKTKKDSTEN